MDNRQGVVSLHSSRLLSILDEASERTFLSNELKGDASKDVLDDKNLVASLSIIFEQSLVSLVPFSTEQLIVGFDFLTLHKIWRLHLNAVAALGTWV